MIVTVRRGADPDVVRRALVDRGLWVSRFSGLRDGSFFFVRPYSGSVSADELLAIDGVEDVGRSKSPHPLLDAQPAAVTLGDPGDGVAIGAGVAPVVMAGPCSVESEDQIHAVAARLAGNGVRILRGGAYKPRTSPYEFQGHGEVALRWLRDAGRANGQLVVTEALGESSVDVVARYADIIQVGSRNMHNSCLLRAAGETGRPVLVKRGMAATVEEWLLAGEYALAGGAASVVFCERGIRSYDPATRNLLDLGAVALLAHVHRVPVVVDPSHALGRRDLIPALSRAAIAAGAAGLLLETHDDPGRALSDGPQALSAGEIEAVLAGLAGVAEAAPR